MGKIDKKLLDPRIIEEIRKEFPGDPALQQIHIARKRISTAAKSRGLSIIEYIMGHNDPKNPDASRPA